jgi:hypothetical protein
MEFPFRQDFFALFALSSAFSDLLLSIAVLP